jgi:hypothetical protein
MLWGEVFPSAIIAVREGSLLLAVVGAFLVAAPTCAQDVQKTAGTEQQPQESSTPSNGTEQDDPHAGNAGMNMVDMNPASTYLMNLASGTSVNAAAWPMPDGDDPLRVVEHDVHGSRFHSRHAAIRTLSRDGRDACLMSVGAFFRMFRRVTGHADLRCRQDSMSRSQKHGRKSWRYAVGHQPHISACSRASSRSEAPCPPAVARHTIPVRAVIDQRARSWSRRSPRA